VSRGVISPDGRLTNIGEPQVPQGRLVAANELSFEVYPGEIFGFLGANGAGKTTAMRMLCGLSVPSSGKATVAGFDVSNDTEKIKKELKKITPENYIGLASKL